MDWNTLKDDLNAFLGVVILIASFILIPEIRRKKRYWIPAIIIGIFMLWLGCDKTNRDGIKDAAMATSQAEARRDDSLAKASEAKYRLLLNNKMDTARSLSEKNINLTSTANNLIKNTEDLVRASSNLIARVDQRTEEGLNNLTSIASQSPQQRQLSFYQEELNDAVKMQEVISYFIMLNDGYAFDRDSLSALKTFDTIINRLKDVYPNYLTSIDQRIDEHWSSSIGIMSAGPDLIRRGFGDASDPNPSSQRRMLAQYTNDGIYEYFAEAYDHLTKANTFIQQRLKRDKVSGIITDRSDLYTVPTAPGDSTVHENQ